MIFLDRFSRIVFARAALVFLAATLCLGSSSRAESESAAPRPNVIVVLADDQGYGDLSCHGNPVLKTPHLDRLHSQSVRFTDFHVAPMCTPTRAQLMSSVGALPSGAMNVSSGRDLLRRDLKTMADCFAASGYRTGIFGKWHLGDMYPYRPKDRGFQDSVVFRSSYIGSAADYWNNDYFDDHYRFGDEIRQVEGYCTDVFFDEAIKWIRDRRDKDEPFFAYIPTNAPHGPLFVPARYREQYEAALADKKLDEDQRQRLARFFGMIANIDDNFGRLDKVLEETGLRDNTIVIFMTDNGGTAGVQFYNAGMKGSKIQLWEGGHRVPCFVRWPAGGLDGGRDIDALTQVQDILPTLTDLCGLEVAEKSQFQGSSLVPLIRGDNESLDDRVLVVQFSRMNVGRPNKDDAAVLWRKWRLLRGNELYNVESDPHQDRNVFDEHPEIVAKLQKHYDQWWAAVEPTLDTFQPSVVGADAQNPTRLCASEWADVFLDQGVQVRRGIERNGTWHIEVEQAGRYEIALCRWPREADTALTASTTPHTGEDCFFARGKALPIARARLRVAEHEVEKDVRPEDHEAVFTLELPKGKTTLRSSFHNEEGKELCGAYYVYVKRLP
ncbi:MAG TPA: arylsulfatase [Planctomycetaceae bacterium]|nr:arylsulfatase [Planctomycetaceae bacterium]